MLYFELVPYELIEIILFNLKDKSLNFGKCSDYVEMMYSKYINNIIKCIYNPKDIFIHKVINSNVNSNTFLNFFRKTETRYLSENKFNGIKFNNDNYREYMDTINDYINKIRYIYLYNMVTFKSGKKIKYVVVETVNKEYMIICINYLHYLPNLSICSYEFNIVNNWKNVWKNELIRKQLMYLHLYSLNVKYILNNMIEQIPYIGLFI
jgi:hypothetical protein